MLPWRRFDRGIKDITRLRQIVNVLVKNGFGHYLQRIDLHHYLELARNSLHLNLPDYRRQVRISGAARIRLVLEELGPTFIKFGQILSTRPDLVPLDLVEELKKLQDDVPSFETWQARRILEKELGRPVTRLFKSFRDEPLAAASMAQVHQARLKSGERVVVKIQRPGIRETIETDLDILFFLANLAQKRIPRSEIYDPVGIIREFAKSIRKEMDFKREGRSIDRFARDFAGDETVHIPRVFWKLSTDRVLTMEEVDGIKISDYPALEAAGLDRKIIAVNGARAILKQIFIDGFFHGDPHPGNIMVLPENVIAFLDFGIVGRIDEKIRGRLGDIFSAVLNRDVDALVRTFQKIGLVKGEVDWDEFRADLADLIEEYYGLPLRELEMGKIINESFQIVFRHRIRIPPAYFLLGKAMVTVEGLGQELDPDFDMVGEARPFIRRLLLRKYSPEVIRRDLFRISGELLELFKVFPEEVQEILAKIKSGRLKVEFEHRGLGSLITVLDKVSNRVSFSIIIGALIVGSSLIIHSGKGPLIFGFPLLGVVGYLAAGVLGLWLVIAILRSGRL